MVQKARIYQLLTCKDAKPDDYCYMVKVQQQIPCIRLRRVGSKSEVQMCLSENDHWLKPQDWLNNYNASVRQRFELECRQAMNVLQPEEFLALLSTCSTDDPEDSVASRLITKLTDEFYEVAKQSAYSNDEMSKALDLTIRSSERILGLEFEAEWKKQQLDRILVLKSSKQIAQ